MVLYRQDYRSHRDHLLHKLASELTNQLAAGTCFRAIKLVGIGNFRNKTERETPTLP